MESPASGCSAHTPSTHASACTVRRKSTAEAPTVTCARLSSRPPITTTSAVGCSASADGDRRRVGEHGEDAVVGQQPGELEVGGRAVEDDHPRAREDLDRRLGERGLLGRQSRARGLNEPCCGAGAQRAAVHALDEPLRRELAQVAPHGVLGHAELLHQARGDDLAVARQRVEDRLAALGGEERGGCTFMHGSACYCVDCAQVRP